MKNNFTKLSLLLIFYFIFFSAHSVEQFNFNVTEIQILENGNKFIGTKRGKIISNDGIIVDADEFEYTKDINILEASGNVKIFDKINNYEIFSNKITYNKNKEIIYTKGKSKAKSLDDSLTINADDFKYEKLLNVITADKNVFIQDDIEDYKINSEFIKYFKNDEKFITKGKTSALIKSKYNFKSKDVVFLRNSMELKSSRDTILIDENNLYNLSNFHYSIENEKLKGEKITINSNYKLPETDKYYFASGIIDLKTKNFIAKDISIEIHKSIFDNPKNDPRLKGVSSNKSGDITVINKGVFTSCQKNDTCPPWAIEAKEIKHDKRKKQINYSKAFLRVYDIPVMYFPKFFHPDPTVDRQSGILKPVLNNSNVLGSSFTLPYYHVISQDSDITSTPTLFNNKTKMLQNEFRKIGKNFNLLTNFGHVRSYRSSTSNKNKNISYLFSNFELDLNLDNYNSSKLYFDLEKVTNDTFLKVFDTNLIENSTSLKPKNQNTLSSELKLILNNEKYNLTTGFISSENLQLRNNDRYQYVLPYYNFDRSIFTNFNNGSINFQSSGSNELIETNKLKSKIVNNLFFSSLDYFSDNGIKSNFNINIKNLNSIGKNVSEYKSSPQIELSSIFEINSILPLKKTTDNFIDYLTPKISLRINPSDMKNHNASERTINVENIFAMDRLGIDDSFETGKSITLGVDYKKEKLDDLNKFFEIKLASVFRDKEENFIPSNTTINKKSSNVFGSISNNFSEHLSLNYKFAVDNNLNELQYNDINTTLSVNNFVTTFNFVKETDEMGDQNFLKNTTSYKIDDNNFVRFNTRRNRKLNLTEFYDLVYEYKNDCLIAGLKYKKTYYEDRDLKPSEDLLFTITLFPLTTYEQKIDQ